MGSLFKGSTDVINTTPSDVQGLRDGVINYLQGGSGGPQGQGVPPPPQAPPTADQLPGFLSPAQKQQMLNGMNAQYQQQMSDYNSKYGKTGTTGPQGSGMPSSPAGPTNFGAQPPGQGGGFNPVTGSFGSGVEPFRGQPAIDMASPLPSGEGTQRYTGPSVNMVGAPAGGTDMVGNQSGMPQPANPAASGFNPMTGQMGSPATQASSSQPSPYDRINATAATASPSFSSAPTNVPYAGNAAPVNYQTAAPVNTPDRSQVRDVTQSPGSDQLWNMLTGVAGGGSAGGPQAVGASASTGNYGPSVDQMGGANSAFFNNMVSQLQPSFTQARTDALAQAKESLGNLTGTSAGNTLGTAMNRSLGDEQATLANYATQGIQTQAGLNTAQGNAGTQASIASANNMTGASQTNAGIGANNWQSSLSGLQNLLGLGQQGQIANQGADQNFLGLASQIGLANMQGAQGVMNNQGNAQLSQSLQNQQLLQNVLGQSITNGMGQSQFNATQAQQGNQFNASQSNAVGSQDAQNFLQMLLGLTNANNAGTAVQSNPSVLGSILGAGTQLGAAALGAKH